MRERRVWTAGLAAACGLAAGCVEHSTDGVADTYTFALWVPVAVAAACVVGAVAGWFLRRRMRVGWVMLVAGPVALICLTPGLVADRVVVDAEHFELRTGLWFDPTVHNVRFAQLSRIEVTRETRQTRRGKRSSFYLVCGKLAGGSETVPIGDLMKDGAVQKILEQAQARGIPVIDRQ